MKIDERIEEMQIRLINLLIQTKSQIEEESVVAVEELGLEKNYAIELVAAFRASENAREASRNAWDSSLESRVENENDIAKYRQIEFETRQHFDTLNEQCVLMLVTKNIAPNMINDEILDKLYEKGLKEEQIDNQALKVAFHYYSESRAKDIQRALDLEKVKGYSLEISGKMTSLENQLRDTMRQNESLKAELKEEKNKNVALINANVKLQKRYKSRVISDEKYFQDARAQIETLKSRLNQAQNMSIIQKLFGRKRKQLSEPDIKIPDTLYKNMAEKIEIAGSEDNSHNLSKDTKQTSITHKKGNIEDLEQ